MNELYSIRTIEDADSLQHYGVLGMKWGHRKPKSELRTNVSTARKNLITSTKNFGSAYAKAYAYSLAHPVSQFKSKKRNVEASKRWRNAMRTNTSVKRSLAAYSKAKKQYKLSDEYRKRKMIGEDAIGTIYGATGAAVINKTLKSSKTYSNGARTVSRLLA